MALRLLVIGGGISGLSLAYLLSGKNNVELTLLEAEERTGGKIWTERAEGFLCEGGPPGFLNSKPRTLELASMLSLEPIRSNDSARRRFIYSDGKLKRLPETPPAFLKSDLMSFTGKLRICLEPFLPRGKKEDETLADFARRRLGKEAFLKLIDPMASGIYAGDPEAMSLRSCFPRINEIERRYGSLIRGMLKLMAERKKSVSAAPTGVLTSFGNGMQAFIDALRESLGDAVRTRSRAAQVEKLHRGYAVHLSDGSRLEADAVVLAVPAHQAAGILKELDGGVSKTLGRIPYPSLAVVCTGFRKEKLQDGFNAFGFLVPHREGRRVLGVVYDSSIFPGRAPEGHVLFRTMVGGARASHLAEQEERKITDLALSELRDLAGVRAEPDFVRVYRHEKAIPQYNVGHQERVRAVDGLMGRHEGLYVTGNALKGIGVNDCIENSFILAEKITEEVL